jgi:hypothetical protein
MGRVKGNLLKGAAVQEDPRRDGAESRDHTLLLAGFGGGFQRSERLSKKNRLRANPFVSRRALPK